MGTHYLPVIMVVTFTNIDSIAPYRLVHTGLRGHTIGGDGLANHDQPSRSNIAQTS